MALIACPGCDTSISDHVLHCPHCGRPIAASSTTAPPRPPAASRPHPAPPPRVPTQARSVPPVRPGAPKGKRKSGCFVIGCLAIIIIVLAFLFFLGTTKKIVDSSSSSAPAVTTSEETARQNAVKSLDEGRKSMDTARKIVSGKTDTADESPLQRAAAEKAREMLAQTIAAELGVTVTVRGARSDRLTLEGPQLDAKWTADFRQSDAVRALQNAGFRRVEVKDGKRYRERFELEGMPQH
jgi:hypothetical protein